MGNWNSGRRAKPAALKILQGNPGKRPLNLNEPVPPAGDVLPPPTLSRAGRLVWDRLAPIAITMRTLTPADTEAFKTLCELQASLDLAAQAKDDRAFTAFPLPEEGDGPATIHAAILLELKIAPVVRQYYEKFGLEPVSRARLVVPRGPEPVSKWAGLKKG